MRFRKIIELSKLCVPHLLISIGNRTIQKKIGRPEANVVEPTVLSIGRVYKVQWKKSKPDYYELARLNWVQGLKQRQVAEITGVRRTTIAAAVKKYKSLFASETGQVG